LAVPPLALAFFGLLILFVAIRQFAETRRFAKKRGHVLLAASECARQPGDVTRFDAVSIVRFGAKDSASSANIRAEMDTCRKRFDALVGEQFVFERPLQVLSFGQRMAFGAFLRRAGIDVGDLDGAYIAWSMPTASFTTGLASYRLGELGRLVRCLLSYFLLETYRKGPTPAWLQIGVGNLIACGGDDDELSRLNRKMLASLSRGDALAVPDLFLPNPRVMLQQVRRWDDHRNFASYSQRVAQSWSVVEYLGGHLAPDEGRRAFRKLLRELPAKGPQEAVFERCFGFGFEGLLERWKASVIERGIGTHTPPPPHAQQALLERVIPILRDERAKRIERIQAVREMGRIGWALGADVLVDLLRTDGRIPRAEIIWSLEAISGLALGDDVERWAEWSSQASLDHGAATATRAI
jgi:hypothetical protein